MKVLVEENGKYVLQETGVLSGTLSAVGNFVTFSPSSGSQVFAMVGLGVVGGYLLGVNFPWEKANFVRS